MSRICLFGCVVAGLFALSCGGPAATPQALAVAGTPPSAVPPHKGRAPSRRQGHRRKLRGTRGP